jgi:hypothetical protein
VFIGVARYRDGLFKAGFRPGKREKGHSNTAYIMRSSILEGIFADPNKPEPPRKLPIT